MSWSDHVRIFGMAGAGLTSMAGSLCWFTASMLQTVALFYGVGQIELFSVLIGPLVFKERILAKAYAGIGLLMTNIVTPIITTRAPARAVFKISRGSGGSAPTEFSRKFGPPWLMFSADRVASRRP
ncbi:hypothetical protein SAMN05428995_102269 [Loktanella sp. DSM 29012]|nr:hypothetical protein SAMN05428995_102269 [Loktanella sp. DSM 29012]